MFHEVNSTVFVRTVPHHAIRVALGEINVDDAVREERGWKLFLLLPRMLLHRAPRGGTIPKAKLLGRFNLFNAGAWLDLLEASRKVNQQAAVLRRRRNRRSDDELAKRVSRAEALVHIGEVSSARQALEGSSLAPGVRSNSQCVERSDQTTTPPTDAAPQGVVEPRTTGALQFG